jgi:phage terminase Nu1 subunit (DNA packaging protein)
MADTPAQPVPDQLPAPPAARDMAPAGTDHLPAAPPPPTTRSDPPPLATPARLLNLDATCSQSAFGLLIGVSQPAVSDMLARGVLQPGRSTGEWLLDYCAHMRDQAAGRGADGELAYQRSELARVSRERAEIKLAVERREFAPVALLEQVLATVGRSVAGVLEPLHVQIHKRIPGLTPEDIKFIQHEVARACDIAATASLALLDVPDEGADPVPPDDPALLSDDDEADPAVRLA